MDKNSNCSHDFLALIHCKKCGEQFHINWLKAVKQAKLDAVVEVLQKTTTVITIKSKGDNNEEATKIALNALKKVKKVYEKAIDENQKETSDVALKAIKKTKRDYKVTIS